jgi:hypothetical protein
LKITLSHSADKVILFPDPSPSSFVNAAHALDGSFPKKFQHDEDIMDDENF